MVVLFNRMAVLFNQMAVLFISDPCCSRVIGAVQPDGRAVQI
jgi:hypothetical protein